jgi:hypothetical protein
MRALTPSLAPNQGNDHNERPPNQSFWASVMPCPGRGAVSPLTQGRDPGLPAEYVLTYTPRDEVGVRDCCEGSFLRALRYMAGLKYHDVQGMEN